MEHIAIDLGGKESQVCIRSSEGKILEQKRVRTAKLEAYLKDRPKSRVIVETSAEAFAIADGALRQGHEAKVVPATLAPALGVGARRTKNDVRDAQALSEVSTRIELPSVHIPSLISRERKAMCAIRDSLIETRTNLVNSVRGWLRTQLRRPRTGAVSTFPKRVRAILLNREEGMPMFIERALLAIEALTAQIKEADAELESLAKEDETCRCLMTVPGVGPATSIRFAAAIDDIQRFSSAHSVESYLGLTPGEDSSSLRQRRTGITKAGPKQTRRVLVQAAWSLFRTRPRDSIVLWAKQIAERRGKRIAAIALARKLAGVLYAIWRDSSRYDPNHTARAS